MACSVGMTGQRNRRINPPVGNDRRRAMCCSPEWLENLRRLAREVDDKQTGSEMFLFVEEGSVDPHQPENIWG